MKVPTDVPWVCGTIVGVASDSVTVVVRCTLAHTRRRVTGGVPRYGSDKGAAAVPFCVF
jgi:hypothetical protein